MHLAATHEPSSNFRVTWPELEGSSSALLLSALELPVVTSPTQARQLSLLAAFSFDEPHDLATAHDWQIGEYESSPENDFYCKRYPPN